MPKNFLHKKLWQMAFGDYNYPWIPVDKQMDEYSRYAPGNRHRAKDHDPLRVGDYEDPQPDLDRWRIVYRLYHIAVDCWWSKLTKELRECWREKIKRGYYPSKIDDYFWKIIEKIVEDPLGVYKILPWKCEPLPPGWEEYIKRKRTIPDL